MGSMPSRFKLRPSRKSVLVTFYFIYAALRLRVRIVFPRSAFIAFFQLNTR